MKVTSHKTAGQGAACVTMDEEGHLRVNNYVDAIRPQIDPLPEKVELLLLPGPHAIPNLNNLLKRLESIYEV